MAELRALSSPTRVFDTIPFIVALMKRLSDHFWAIDTMNWTDTLLSEATQEKLDGFRLLMVSGPCRVTENARTGVLMVKRFTEKVRKLTQQLFVNSDELLGSAFSGQEEKLVLNSGW